MPPTSHLVSVTCKSTLQTALLRTQGKVVVLQLWLATAPKCALARGCTTADRLDGYVAATKRVISVQ